MRMRGISLRDRHRPDRRSPLRMKGSGGCTPRPCLSDASHGVPPRPRNRSRSRPAPTSRSRPSRHASARSSSSQRRACATARSRPPRS
ncbi:hypothetical protein ACFPRL_18260 [Pseudoclavibacter helvolus]